MAINIYNSLSREKKPFECISPPEVKMYVCGPTVYDQPHIGHARSAYIFDVIRRYLEYCGYKVKFVRNVTDVDDKIIDKARKELPSEDLNTAFKKVAEKYLDLYHQALKSLGIKAEPPDIIEPKASEYIPKMINFIQDLITRGVAYPAGGDVYFDITKAKDYGKLSNQDLNKMESGARVSPTENKKNPLDFALWKSAKVNEPSWDSPWGKGRPGWHIECSVMSSDILGDEFDIHGGGIDLIFPHHENEVVQSEGAGKKFARYWIHHGLLTINGQKMAKSLGNFITIEKILNDYPADVLKVFYLQAHYSHPIDFTQGKMEEARIATYSLFKALSCSQELKNISALDPEDKATADEFKGDFKKSMDDNFNTPQALAGLFSLVRHVNSLLADYEQEKTPRIRVAIDYSCDILRELGRVLGLSVDKFDVEDQRWYFRAGQGVTDQMIEATKSEYIEQKIAERLQFKKEKNFAQADKIRKELEQKNIILEDTKDGTTWHRKL